MVPEMVIYSIVVIWLIAAVVVVGYPLLSGRIRVGLDPVNREADPRGFRTAYIISIGLFLAVSLAAGLIVRSLGH